MRHAELSTHLHTTPRQPLWLAVLFCLLVSPVLQTNIRAAQAHQPPVNAAPTTKPAAGNLSTHPSAGLPAPVALLAPRPVAMALDTAPQTQTLQSTNSSSNASVGVTIGVGGQQNGISFQLAAAQARGRSNGSETTWDNSQITASEQLSVKTGRDASLQGAQLAGDRVKLDIGRDLTLQTLQNQSDYQSSQSSSGFSLSLCIPPICYGQTVSGSLNVARSSLNHNYLSAVGQSGIAAGQGGFDINVKGHTQLTGAAITSQAAAEHNQLSTGSLASVDLTNRQQTQSQSNSLSLSYNGAAGGMANLTSNLSSNLLSNLAAQVGLPKNGSQSSQTQSVISPATINISGTGNAQTDAQSQAVASLLTSRDAKTANQSLTNTLSLQQVGELERQQSKQRENLQAAQIAGQALSQMIGDYAQAQQKALQKQALAEGRDPSSVKAWGDGSTEKTLLHAISGAITAKLAGTSLAAGASAGALHEQLTPVLTQLTRELLGDGPQRPNLTGLSQAEQSAALKAYDKAVQEHDSASKGLQTLSNTLLGVAVGAVIGNNVQSAAQAAQATYNAEMFNRQLHPSELNKIKRLASSFAGNSMSVEEAEARLTRQALKMVDKEWNTVLAGNDEAALKFLKANSGSFTADGQNHTYFQETDLNRYRNSNLFVDTTRGSQAQMYINAVVVGNDPSVQAARANKTAETTGAAAGMIGSVVGMVADTAKTALQLVQLRGDLKSSDPDARNQAQAQIDQMATKFVGFFADKPVETAKQYVNDQLDRAAMLHAQGEYAQAKKIETDLALGVIGTVAGGTTIIRDAGKLAGNVGKIVVKQADGALERSAQTTLLKSGGAYTPDGNPLLDMSKLTNEQKGAMGDLFGGNTAKQIVPDGQKIARMPGVGETGIDDLYKVNRPDVDYVTVEYKFVGDNKAKGSSRLGSTNDGKQGSESWVLGSGRLEKAVGDRTIAADVADSVKAGRVESWVVTTRSDGSTFVEVLDAAGKPKPIDTSKIILPKRNLSGAQE
ncbi:hemagglutinin repeat-containing protein [Parvibium lacunae]|uniref:Uncharacterized protein n=1 Tax=Parvibium lacunae TaxID=1888893 RepID=A0A368KZJ0_9BURK|nr:hemagglutinin repeat-containing protein [Parvibium lacunae]RCS56441.1 hypothetical protein DU000_12435 [Parvibium lacunae]